MAVTNVNQGGNPLGTEKIGKLIVAFGIPSVISQVVNALYNIVDQIFIGQGVGYLGNGATSVIMPLTVLAMALALLIDQGAASYLSLKLGERDEESAAKGVGNAITMLLIIGVALMCAVWSNRRQSSLCPRLWKNYFLRHTLFHH